jgi:hypothetical protein
MFLTIVAYTILKLKKADVEDFTLMVCAIAETLLWGIILFKVI